MIRAVIIDIEGTTIDVAFVRDVLFPCASKRLAAFVNDNAGDPAVIAALAQTRALAGHAQLTSEEVVAILLRWIAEDRKATPLKTLQGLIWDEAYRDGSLRAPVYDDVAPALRAWRARGLALYVYSSGSVAAQKLLFTHSTAGDLTPLFDGYFDTAIGGKLERTSYAAIAQHIGFAPEHLLFLSDHPGEVAAARAADLQALRVERGAPLPDAPGQSIRSFAQLDGILNIK